MRIAVVNKSTTNSNEEVAAWAHAVHRQITDHVALAWNMRTAPVTFYKDESRVPASAYPMYVQDDIDVSGALGYHDVDDKGRPYAIIATKVSIQNGAQPSGVFSHEGIELFLDVACNLFAIDFQTGTLYAVEGSDAVESDSYLIDGIEVSNFILPDWFNRNHASGAKFDALGKLSAPFTMTRGGYLIYMKGGAEQQKFGEVVLDVGPDVPAWKKAIKWQPAARTVQKLNVMKTLAEQGAAS